MRFVLGCVFVFAAAPVWAQSAERAPLGTVSVGAEASASISRSDDLAFFNYTDYDNDALRTVRVRLNAEWQLHPRFSLLGEARVIGDRAEASAYFLRWRPVERWHVDLQAGRIPPVIGAFARRAYGRDNPLVGAPLAYQYLTSLRPDALPATIDDLLRMRARGWQPSYPLGAQTLAPGLPLVSAFRWDTGVEAHWRRGWLDAAGAVTRGAPSRPVVSGSSPRPQYSGRAAVVSPMGFEIGVSGARGQWIDRSALSLVPSASQGASAQTLAGVDAQLQRGHWIVSGEWMRTTFALPVASGAGDRTNLTAASGFLEARYRFLPRWQIAGRFDALRFSDVSGAARVPTSWDANVTRVEATVGFRALRRVEVRGGYQYDWRDGGRTRRLGFPTAQVLWWF